MAARSRNLVKLCFVTTGLEPGKDGVGDYTRLLAAECKSRGCVVATIALNDSHIAEPIVSPATLRLPRAMGWPGKVARAREFAAEFSPDWFSLQFVCYGYHRRGWVFGIAPRLHAIFNGVRRQIMFHELWIGMHRSAPLREKLEGLIQRSAVLGMVRDLNPQVVHANAEAYAAVLRRCGIEASALPVFGNIPVNQEPAPLEVLCAKSGVECRGIDRSSTWLFGMFGNIPPELDGDGLLRSLENAAAANGKQCVLVAFGKRGPGPQARLEQLVSRFDSSNVRFLTFSEMSPPDASSLMQQLDFGIATAPRLMLAKSGVVAAMCEHGLPMIVPRDDVHFTSGAGENSEPDADLIFPGPDLATKLAQARPSRAATTVASTGETMLRDLEAASGIK